MANWPLGSVDYAHDPAGRVHDDEMPGALVDGEGEMGARPERADLS